jgi:hypothetical protein
MQETNIKWDFAVKQDRRLLDCGKENWNMSPNSPFGRGLFRYMKEIVFYSSF